jgi:23S rRNA (cytidine1920-2'-O)/16S rRNA (cytidine1409-2'-O)-methyltransferase
MHKVRLIELLKSRNPTHDERELFAAVLRGEVTVSGQKVTKPGTFVAPDAAVEMRARPPFVSRGGVKLAAALELWRVPCAGTVWVDAGCSTGGFTDCLLQRGASFVHAIDVGENLLDWRLRGDKRVKLREGTNIMAVKAGDLDPQPESAVADLSFRSLRGAAAHILGLTTGGWGIFLVKPQFELHTDAPGFTGVVRDAGMLRQILSELVARLSEEGVNVESAVASPIKGRKGNTEFLFLLRAGRSTVGAAEELLKNLLRE